MIVLAQDMAAGLAANAAVYPAPPVAPADLQAAIGAYVTARDAAVAAVAAAEQATATKNEALQALTDDMKADLRYAENTVDYDDKQLKKIGWGGRASKTSLEAPGQTRSLEAPREGEGWVFLDWKEPVDGGAVAVYKIQRRLRPDGPSASLRPVTWPKVPPQAGLTATRSSKKRPPV
ncbi:MAG: hypothetical protein U9Q79_03590 [Candidatus Hydrogenedentes bacterium]|nr:hypothetical protein [Candidatus Hydrogenedentota bacterium]